MSDNPEFDALIESEFDEQYQKDCMHLVVDDMLSTLSGDPVELTLMNGRTFTISEREAYELAASATHEFDWLAIICSVPELRENVETLCGREMPDDVALALREVARVSKFWGAATNSLASLMNINLAFFMAENMMMELDSVETVVNHELNLLAAELTKSESYEAAREAASEIPQDLDEEVVAEIISALDPNMSVSDIADQIIDIISKHTNEGD